MLEREFKKSAYRPWNPDLLKQNLSEQAASPPAEYLQRAKKMIYDDEPTARLNDTGSRKKHNKDSSAAELNRQLQDILDTKTKQKKVNNSMLIGGFLEPSQIDSHNAARDKQHAEHLDQVEKVLAEAEQSCANLLQKLQFMVEQAEVKDRQLHSLLEATKVTEKAKLDETKYRMMAEDKMALMLQEMETLNSSLESEHHLRAAAEEKSRYTVEQLLKLELEKKEIAEGKQQATAKVQQLSKALEQNQVSYEEQLNTNSKLSSELEELRQYQTTCKELSSTNATLNERVAELEQYEAESVALQQANTELTAQVATLEQNQLSCEELNKTNIDLSAQLAAAQEQYRKDSSCLENKLSSATTTLEGLLATLKTG